VFVLTVKEADQKDSLMTTRVANFRLLMVWEFLLMVHLMSWLKMMMKAEKIGCRKLVLTIAEKN
jgi:hypothetical protein